MSAYICGPDHFDQLAAFAAQRDQFGFYVDPRYLHHADNKARIALRKIHEHSEPRLLATVYGDTLYQENIRSVRHLYPSDTWDDLPGPIKKPLHYVITGAELARVRLLSPVAILKMCDGLEYQSCETEDWRASAAYELLTSIRKAAIRKLPGYEEAPWDYWEDEYKQEGRAA